MTQTPERAMAEKVIAEAGLISRTRRSNGDWPIADVIDRLANIASSALKLSAAPEAVAPPNEWVGKVRDAFEQIVASDPEAYDECCGGGVQNHPEEPPECCAQPIRDNAARVIAREALALLPPTETGS